MWYAWLAGLVLGLHLLFVLFVVFGGLLAFKWRMAAWWHLPAVLWATLVEFTGWICPLTSLENRFRQLAGESGSPSDFLTQYLIPLLYPEELTRTVQILLGTLVLVGNLIVYAVLWRGSRRQAQSSR
ncbi:MAG TPA: DUF2784 domain-containing protein [Nitrospira sp.]|nr:DUF2784 domain-containing protein [Nitrospira sp.]